MRLRHRQLHNRTNRVHLNYPLSRKLEYWLLFPFAKLSFRTSTSRGGKFSSSAILHAANLRPRVEREPYRHRSLCSTSVSVPTCQLKPAPGEVEEPFRHWAKSVRYSPLSSRQSIVAITQSAALAV